MKAVHKSGIVTHFWRHRPEKVTNTLLVFYINFEVPNHNQTATCSNTFSASAELTGLHITFHDIDPILLIEGYPRYLIEAHNIILANQAPLPIAIVDEHTGNCCFASGDKMGVGGNLLKKVRFTRTARTKFNHVIVALNEWNHPQQKDILSPCRQAARFKANTTQKKLLPILSSKAFATSGKIIEHTPFG